MRAFAVGEIAKTLLGGELTRLTFNLSQFQSPTELPQAFHRIRDLVLEQKLPFVFWDEFDAPLRGNRLGWLSSCRPLPYCPPTVQRCSRNSACFPEVIGPLVR
jgi:hypothetical protein